MLASARILQILLVLAVKWEVVLIEEKNVALKFIGHLYLFYSFNILNCLRQHLFNQDILILCGSFGFPFLIIPNHWSTVPAYPCTNLALLGDTLGRGELLLILLYYRRAGFVNVFSFAWKNAFEIGSWATSIGIYTLRHLFGAWTRSYKLVVPVLILTFLIAIHF